MEFPTMYDTNKLFKTISYSVPLHSQKGRGRRQEMVAPEPLNHPHRSAHF